MITNQFPIINLGQSFAPVARMYMLVRQQTLDYSLLVVIVQSFQKGRNKEATNKFS